MKIKKSITFTTDRFSNLGDSARLDYKVKNTSTQYDADVTINCTNEVSEYVSVNSQFDGNNIPLENVVNMKAQEVKKGYINANLIKAYVGEDTSMEIKCHLAFTATSRESYAYSLNFDSNGGSLVEDKIVILNENYGELQVPLKKGYNFLGWYDEEDNKVDEDTKLDEKGNQILRAKWEAKVYPVGIITNSNGSSESSTINVAYENTANIKVTPNKNYYLSSISCSEGYIVEGFNDKIPKYAAQTVKIRNDGADVEGTCTFEFSKGIFEYNYTGKEQSFSVPLDGNYNVEIYGAGGNNSTNGGKGSSTSGSKVTGSITLKKQTLLYVYIGQKEGAFNGGGSGGKSLNGVATSTHGSGASDIRLIKASNGSWYNTSHSSWNTDDSLLSRIIIAGGGGGAKATSGRSFNGATPLDTYYNSTSYLYASYPRDGESSNKTLGLGSSEVTGTSKLTDTGDIGNGASGGGGGGWYGGKTSAANHTYVYSIFTAAMKIDTSGKTLGVVAINGNRLAGTEVHCYSGTSYINNNYEYDGYTFKFTNTSIEQQKRNGNGYAKITLMSIN